MVHNIMYACIDTDYFWICAMIGCNQFVFVLRRLLPRQCKVSCRPPANADEMIRSVWPPATEDDDRRQNLK